VRDEDYGYLAKRHVVEQNLARAAKCCASAAAHQGMANAYLGRLQSMILSPARYRSGMSWTSCEEWLLPEPIQARSNPNTSMRIPHAVKG
jgi:hypothetical protein